MYIARQWGFACLFVSNPGDRNLQISERSKFWKAFIQLTTEFCHFLGFFFFLSSALLHSVTFGDILGAELKNHSDPRLPRTGYPLHALQSLDF